MSTCKLPKTEPDTYSKHYISVSCKVGWDRFSAFTWVGGLYLGPYQDPGDPASGLLGWKGLGAGERAGRLGVCTLDLGEPEGLPVVLRGDCQSVEEDE